MDPGHLGEEPPYMPSYPPQESIVISPENEPNHDGHEQSDYQNRRFTRERWLTPPDINVDEVELPEREDAPTSDEMIQGPLGANVHKLNIEMTTAELYSPAYDHDDDEYNSGTIRLLSIDKLGGVIEDIVSSNITIHEAHALDMRRGGNRHRTVTEILNREYRTLQRVLEQRETNDLNQVGFDAHPENTGFWIFGAGHAYVLPYTFADSHLRATFISKVICLYLLCLILRCICLNEVILNQSVHDYLYEHNVFGYPMLAAGCFYIITSAIVTARSMEEYTRLLPVTILLFLLLEIARVVIFCFFSLACEFCVIAWYETLDVFKDYNPGDPEDRNHWRRLNITPPIFLLITTTMITINIFIALCLEVYTDMSLGTPEMFRATVVASCMTFLINIVLIKFYSVGLVPMWDGFQVFFGSALGISKTWIFLYNLQRLVGGKITHLEGMGLRDVIFALMVIS